MENSIIYKRLGDILIALDEVELLYDLKLVGDSSLQFFHQDLGYITNKLTFDLHTTKSGSDLNELRKKITLILPKLLSQKNFKINYKKTKLTQTSDHYIIIDNENKNTYEILIDYLNRYHILPPEYYARIDKVFIDLHVNSLATLENYGRYFAEITTNIKTLKYLFDNNKILPQQINFIKKIIVFYQTIFKIDFKIDNLKKILEPKYHQFVNELYNFDDESKTFIDNFKNGSYNPELILPKTLANNVIDHSRGKIK